jgi:hypothetical protein
VLLLIVVQRQTRRLRLVRFGLLLRRQRASRRSMPTGQAFEESTQTLHSLERNAEDSRPGRRLHWTSRRCRVWKAVQMILVRDHPPHRFKMLASLSLLDWDCARSARSGSSWSRSGKARRRSCGFLPAPRPGRARRRVQASALATGHCRLVTGGDAAADKSEPSREKEWPLRGLWRRTPRGRPQKR